MSDQQEGPGPEFQPGPFNISTGYREVDGVGRCIYIDIQTSNNRTVIFFPPGAARALGQSLVDEDSGIEVAKILPVSPFQPRRN